MQVDVRREPRNPSKRAYTVSWQGEDGLTRSAHADGVDVSHCGIGMQCAVKIQPATVLYVQDQDNRLAGYSVVRHCTPRNGGFFIGVELNEEARKSAAVPLDESLDYYEFLQISPRAEPATIQRIYRFLASRFHPDNPETGDPEKFLLLNRAFAVLSDPERRSAYDATLEARDKPIAAFESLDFMDGVEGESNRRLAVLSLLYRRCRASVENPKVSLAEMETMMAFPRDYLDFTTWYLRSKKLITRSDNSDFALTVLGVDYVEENMMKLPVLRKLLNAGAAAEGPESEGPVRERTAEDFMLGPIPVDTPDTE